MQVCSRSTIAWHGISSYVFKACFLMLIPELAPGNPQAHPEWSISKRWGTLLQVTLNLET